jgi:hypothetical protein
VASFQRLPPAFQSALVTRVTRQATGGMNTRGHNSIFPAMKPVLFFVEPFHLIGIFIDPNVYRWIRLQKTKGLQKMPSGLTASSPKASH